MDSSPAIDADEIVAIQRQEAREVYAAREGCRDGLPRVVLRALDLFDGDRSLQQVLAEIGLGMSKGRSVVRRLVALGLVERVTPGRRSEQEPGGPFSALEEAFFAADVEPLDECDLSFPRLGERMRALLGRLRQS